MTVFENFKEQKNIIFLKSVSRFSFVSTPYISDRVVLVRKLIIGLLLCKDTTLDENWWRRPFYYCSVNEHPITDFIENSIQCWLIKCNHDLYTNVLFHSNCWAVLLRLWTCIVAAWYLLFCNIISVFSVLMGLKASLILWLKKNEKWV